ncbi:MAG: thiamine pyrophosphate-dependent dehydrogenase E1 component subunit alpha [Deltaproteobacteria bacterium]|jgi:pyruvate dehydrogenase E1 component alpha subunit|nr:thiamine pyrophosphate-dependent dehydrogenase E1 component subunit alpha [Deltaproteobacteria bacterium]MBW2537392.1 thiamine pyrophosphate-dependent dehydrogenase E1 component subunit alpha [Deltaproteobacteria bacterium]
MNLQNLYRHMARARAFEFAVEDLWNQGLISGEMHLGTGEEAVAAGVVTHLRGEDGLALTHRSTPPMVVRGVPLRAMLRELLGKEDGLCGGRGGHMHLMSRQHRVISSGIVGSSMPAAAGLALAAKRLRPSSIAVAFVGDGAMNQGMALETLNLAAVWSLPLIVVCIDNGWAIATTSESMSAGDLRERARAFGWTVGEAEGTDVSAVHAAAGTLVEQTRAGRGPALLYAKCPRLDGHFLGDPLLRQVLDPLGEEGRETLAGVLRAATEAGGGLVSRFRGVSRMVGVMAKARVGPQRGGRQDPLRIVRRAMHKHRPERDAIDREVSTEINEAVAAALSKEASHG